MDPRVRQRLRDIVAAVDLIESLLADAGFETFVADNHMRAAFERYLEVISEASRHVPQELKAQRPNVPWRNIADIGNHIRHAYHRVDPEILWNTFADGKLAGLRKVCDELLG